MIDLTPFESLVALDHGLSVVVTCRADHTPHATVVNAGVVPHPLEDTRVVAFVSAGGSRKLHLLRADPTVAVVVRAGWRWTTVEGVAQLIGPDDPHPGVDEERLRLLRREIFTAIGAPQGDWDSWDRVMQEERWAAVLVTPTRVYSFRG
jgi:PPOX class probable F420-dependent enzyme